MRHEATTVSNPLASSESTSTSTRAPADEAACGVDRVGPVLLGILVAATCLTVAVLASAWLVVPYLAVLTLILGVPRGSRPRVSGRTTRIDAPTDPSQRSDPPHGDGPYEAAVALESAADAPPTAPIEAARPRRRRGRGRKALPAPEAGSIGVSPQWVRVGPGKFVRADSPPDEVEVEVATEIAVDVPARVVVEDADETEARELEASAAPDGPGETATEDQGIAPEAADALADTDPVADDSHASRFEVKSAADDHRMRQRPAPAVRLVGTLTRTSRRGPTRTVAAAPRWNARAGRTSRVLPGFVRPAPARRNLRHSGRFHHANRLYPPRSPPARTP